MIQLNNNVYFISEGWLHYYDSIQKCSSHLHFLSTTYLCVDVEENAEYFFSPPRLTSELPDKGLI